MVRDQVLNAVSAAFTAASIWSGEASGSSSSVSSVFGFSTVSGVSVPVSNFEPMSICVSMKASYFPLPATASPSRVR